MERKIANDLLSWKNDKKGKCLTVQGQRQVGKTYIIKQFANENYEHVVYIDFSKMQRMKEAFNGDFTVEATSFDQNGTIDFDGLNRTFAMLRELLKD